MIRKIVLFFLFPMLVIALLLHFVGVEQVEFGDKYYVFLSNVSNNLGKWAIAIPEIPKIVVVTSSKGLNYLIDFVNTLTSFANALVLVVNAVIGVIQFILTLLYSFIDFRNSFVI